MKFEEETRRTVTRVYLSAEEYETLKRANNIIDRIWEKLEEADDINSTVQTVYNAIDDIGNSLEVIMSNTEAVSR